MSQVPSHRRSQCHGGSVLVAVIIALALAAQALAPAIHGLQHAWEAQSAVKLAAMHGEGDAGQAGPGSCHHRCGPSAPRGSHTEQTPDRRSPHDHSSCAICEAIFAARQAVAPGTPVPVFQPDEPDPMAQPMVVSARPASRVDLSSGTPRGPPHRIV